MVDMEVGVAGACLRVRSSVELRSHVLFPLNNPTYCYIRPERPFDVEASTLERDCGHLLSTQVKGFSSFFSVNLV